MPANPAATVNTPVKGTFTATGSSVSITGMNLDVSISGTFVGTVAVERKMGDNWVAIESYTAPVEKVVENAHSHPHRLTCSAYTSGTITYCIEKNN